MQNWIVPCNLKFYDVFGAFTHLSKIDWKQSSKGIEEGDMVYLYVSSPIRAIMFKCRVTKAHMDHLEIDDSAYYKNGHRDFEEYPVHMQLELVDKYDSQRFPAAKLAEHGMKGNVQCQRRMEDSVLEFIMQK